MNNEVRFVKATWLRVSVGVLFGISLTSTCWGQFQTPVPEIDGNSGAIALTAVAGALLWFQQARRRR